MQCARNLKISPIPKIGMTTDVVQQGWFGMVRSLKVTGMSPSDVCDKANATS